MSFPLDVFSPRSKITQFFHYIKSALRSKILRDSIFQRTHSSEEPNSDDGILVSEPFVSPSNPLLILSSSNTLSQKQFKL